MRTQDLIGAQLDWAVAKCEGVNLETFTLYYHPTEPDDLDHHGFPEFHYSTVWAQGGPIIEREHINLRPTFTEGGYRTSQSTDAVNAKIDLPNGATVFDPAKVVQEYGPTPLIAAMRAYVMAKHGDEINIPEELK